MKKISKYYTDSLESLLPYIFDFIFQTGPFMLAYDIQKNKFIEKENPIYLDYKLQLQKNGLFLKNITDQTDELCKLAVLEFGSSLKFCKTQTPELCLLAIQQFEFSIKFVKNQTRDLCLFALKKNGLVIKDIREPTEEMYIQAVLQNGYAIEYIKNPSKEVSRIAAFKNGCYDYDLMKWNQSSINRFEILNLM